MYFHIGFCFFSWYFYRNYELCNSIKICAITSTIKKYKSIINKNTKKHTTIVLLAKTELNIIEALNSQAIIASNICHDGFVLINNVLKEYDHMIEEMKNLST